MNQHNSDKMDALTRAGQLLNRRRYTVSEMKKKLAGAGYSDEEIRETVAYLLERRYLDDEDFSRAYISDKSRFQRKGSLLLKKELLARGVDGEIIDQVLAREYGPDKELENARKLLLQWQGKSDKTQEQLLRKLAGKGYPVSICLSALRSDQSD